MRTRSENGEKKMGVGCTISLNLGSRYGGGGKTDTVKDLLE